MSQVPYRYRPSPAVMTAPEALAYGWRFFVSNGLIAVVFVGGGLVFDLLDVMSGSSYRSRLLPVLTESLVVIVLQLALFRRAFDDWDEQQGRAEPAEFSDAVVTAAKGALPRVGAWIGWNLVLGLVVLVIWFPFLLLASEPSNLSVLLLVVSLVVTAVALVYFGFVPTAVADRPGNPFDRSAEVVKGNFWPIFGTFVMIGVILIGGGWIVNSVAGALTEAAGPLLGLVAVGAYAIVARTVVVGALVGMYRSIIPPEQLPTFNWQERSTEQP